MVQSTQDSLSKANEFLSHYSQYLPDDYFEDHSSDDDFNSEQDLKQFANDSLSAISG